MYTILDTKQVTELSMARCGWFNPRYELTDGACTYGELSYNWISGCRAKAISATGSWLFKRDGVLSRTILITDENDTKIGEITRPWFSFRATLTLQTGFRADFHTTSIFARVNIWESDTHGKILQIKRLFFGLRDTIYIDQSTTPAALIPLLILLGEHLIILRRRRKSRD